MLNHTETTCRANEARQRINLPEGRHDDVMIHSDLHPMVAEWTQTVTAFEQTLLRHYGEMAGKRVADVVPTLCYARVSLTALGLCSLASDTVVFDPVEFGRRCEAIAREQIQRYRTAFEAEGTA